MDCRQSSPRLMDNVAIFVEDQAADDDELLGIYEGIPLTERDSGYTMTFPDRITIYRLPTLLISHDAEEVRRQVRITVVHEIAHHFGIDDDRSTNWATPDPDRRWTAPYRRRKRTPPHSGRNEGCLIPPSSSVRCCGSSTRRPRRSGSRSASPSTVGGAGCRAGTGERRRSTSTAITTRSFSCLASSRAPWRRLRGRGRRRDACGRRSTRRTRRAGSRRSRPTAICGWRSAHVARASLTTRKATRRTASTRCAPMRCTWRARTPTSLARPRRLPRRSGVRRPDLAADAGVHRIPARSSRAAGRGAQGLRGVRPSLQAGVERSREPLAAVDPAELDDLRRPRHPRRLEHVDGVAPARWSRRHGGRAASSPGSASYWVYQHLGNLSPQERARRRGLVPDLLSSASGERLRPTTSVRCSMRSPSGPTRTPTATAGAIARDVGRNRMVVVDSRAARVLTPETTLDPRRRGDGVARRSRCAAATTTCSSATSLPFLLSTGLHEFEAWNEAVAAGAWGARLRGAGREGAPSRGPGALGGVPGRVSRAVADMVCEVADGRAWRRAVDDHVPVRRRAQLLRRGGRPRRARAGSSRRRVRRSATRCPARSGTWQAFSSKNIGTRHRRRVCDGRRRCRLHRSRGAPCTARGSTTTSRRSRPTAANSGSAGKPASIENDDHAHPKLRSSPNTASTTSSGPHPAGVRRAGTTRLRSTSGRVSAPRWQGARAKLARFWPASEQQRRQRGCDGSIQAQPKRPEM